MKVLVTGASGKLGAYLLRDGTELDIVGCSRSAPLQNFGRPVELYDLVAGLVPKGIDPDVILHTAALSAIADCLQSPERADQVNHQVTARLAEWCAERGRRFVYVSTDMVFDGEHAPYAEDARAVPLSEYGRSKLRGEQAALRHGTTLVARVALMVGPALGNGRAYYDHLVSTLRTGQPISLFQDEWRSMISYEDVASALLQLCRSDATGIVHLGGPRLSRWELGRLVAEKLGCPQLVVAGYRSDYPTPQPRPRDLSLADTRLAQLLPHWRARSVPEQLDAWLT